jgi:hypothetical protein
MGEPFLAVVLMGAVASLALGTHLWRLAPAVPIALAGGLAGAIGGLMAWVFVPENLEQLDLLDGGLQASYGNALPAVARGFTIGIVVMGMVSLRVGRSSSGSPNVLRRAAVEIVGVGLALGCIVRSVLAGACAGGVADSCAENTMVAASIVVDAVVLGLVLLVVSRPQLPEAT